MLPLLAVTALGGTSAPPVSAAALTPVSATMSDLSTSLTCSADFCGNVSATGVKFRGFPLAIAATGTVTVVLDWDDPTADLNLGLRDPSGTWVKWTSSRTSKPETLSNQVATTGQWTIGVTAKTGSANFTLTVTTPPVQKGTVNGTVWVDGNHDGIRQTGETGLAGATAQLLTPTDTIVMSTVSAADGTYAFVAPIGNYRVAVKLPAGYSYGPSAQGSDPTADSDVSPRTSFTSVFALGSGSVLTYDAAAEPTGDTTSTGSVDSGGSVSASSTVTAKAGGSLTVSLNWDESSSANLGMTLTAPGGSQVATAPAGTPVLVMTATVGAAGKYTLTVNAVSGAAHYVADVGGSALQAPVVPVFQRQIGGSGRAGMYPSGLDVDPSGNIYVADTGNDGVQAFNPDGSVKWKDLSWGRRNGQFSEPRDVAYLNGKVYVADTGNNRIQVLDASDGTWLATWPTFYGAIMGISAGVDASGNPVILGTDGQISANVIHVHDPATGAVIETIGRGFGTGNGQLNEPRDAATDSTGNIYVADFRNHRVAIFGPTGSWIGSFGSLGSAHGQFNGPYGIDLDDANNIYVTDANNGRIEEFNHNDQYVSTFGSPGTGPGLFFQLRRAVVGSGSNPLVYGADLWADKIVVFNHDGSTNAELGNVTPPAGGFNKPFGASVASDGTTYVADTTNQRIQVFDPSGAFQTMWGTRGFGDTLDGLNWPHALALDSTTGTEWVADTKNNRLVQYDQTGAETGHRIGSLGSGSLQFHWPYAISSASGDLFVADTWNSRVVRITPGATSGATLDWTATGLNFPKGIAVANGIVYVADTLNSRIVELNATDGSLIEVIRNSALHDPEGIAVAPNGDIWVTDTSWNRLEDFAPDGTLRQIFGHAGTDNNGFSTPGDINISQQGSSLVMYVVDTGNDRISVFKIG